MHWANVMTGLRLAAAPVIGWTAAAELWRPAAGLLALAIITDMLDGMLARRSGQASNQGGLFDHGADCLFVTCALAGLAHAGWVTWLLPVLVPLAFGQYVLDSRALAGQRLRTNVLGKSNGVCYFVLAGVVIFAQALGWAGLPEALTGALAWALVASTVLSMGERFAFLLRRKPTI